MKYLKIFTVLMASMLFISVVDAKTFTIEELNSQVQDTQLIADLKTLGITVTTSVDNANNRAVFTLSSSAGSQECYLNYTNDYVYLDNTDVVVDEETLGNSFFCNSVPFTTYLEILLNSIGKSSLLMDETFNNNVKNGVYTYEENGIELKKERLTINSLTSDYVRYVKLSLNNDKLNNTLNNNSGSNNSENNTNTSEEITNPDTGIEDFKYVGLVVLALSLTGYVVLNKKSSF